jgi:hypothetical protein
VREQLDLCPSKPNAIESLRGRHENPTIDKLKKITTPGEEELLKMLRKVISGGQTGADRAGLDFAIETDLEHGGYVPRGRKAQDGRIDDRYNLFELSTSSYPMIDHGDQE